MTVCIAAICRQENSLVAVTDLMLSTDFLSHDTQSLKVSLISKSGRWIMMFSGDPSVHLDVQNRVTRHLADGPEEMRDLEDACEQAFQGALRHRIESKVLSPYGMTLASFLEKGRSYFGPSQHSRLCLKIESVHLRTDFLVMGFDSNARPYVFTVLHPGVASHRGALGFHAIGAGDILAMGSLAATFDVNLPVDDLVYRLCEAKFASELAPSVGKKTYALKLKPDGKQYRLKPEQLDPVRTVARRNLPPIPPEARREIAGGWVEFRWVYSPPPNR